jgi:hypothetical protein
MEESLQCATQQIEINAIIIESIRNEQIKILLVLKQVFEIIDNLGKKIDNAKRYKIAKPFLKWLGGKTQIIRTILNSTTTMNYLLVVAACYWGFYHSYKIKK